MRIHGFLRGCVVAHAGEPVFHLKREALAACSFIAAARLFITLEPELFALALALAQIRDDGQRHAIDRDAPAAKHALGQARALAG